MLSASSCKPPKQLFTCLMCNQIMIKPITLPCGDTFCRPCLNESLIKNNLRKSSNRRDSLDLYKVDIDKIQIQMENQQKQQLQQKPQQLGQPLKNNKLPTCPQCQNIIWRSIDTMSQNIVIQTLLQNYYSQQMKDRLKFTGQQMPKNRTNVSLTQGPTSQFTNKILIRIYQPQKKIPFPHCYTQIEFESPFITEINEQSHQLVIVWEELSQRGLGLLGAITKIQPINASSHFTNYVLQNPQKVSIPTEKYKAIFIGKKFVELTDVGTVTINIRNKFIIISEKKISKILVDLELCDCRVYNSKHYDAIGAQNLYTFFGVYDQMNNPHYMRQIYKLIVESPFSHRNNVEDMIYCALRVLKITNQQRHDLVMSFDNQKRIQFINNFLLSKKNAMLDEIMNVSVPGKSNPGIVLLIILFLFLLSMFQDYFIANQTKNIIT